MSAAWLGPAIVPNHATTAKTRDTHQADDDPRRSHFRSTTWRDGGENRGMATSDRVESAFIGRGLFQFVWRSRS
jgi:hypothetical protein